jgi:hypothetical protein
MHRELWWGHLRKRSHMENSGIDKKVILKRIFKKWNGAWTELIWLRTGADGGLL